MHLDFNDKSEFVFNGMNLLNDTGLIFESHYHFWLSHLYNNSFYKNCIDNKRFSYYDSSNIFKYLFFGWVNKWSRYISSEYVEPYKFHPLPIADQVLYWQPIFSKHVSDGLIRLENYETNKSQFKINTNKHSSLIFTKALWLTFWKRTLFVIIFTIATNILSMSIAILVKKLLKMLNVKPIRIIKVIILLISVICLQIIDSIFSENIKYYSYRLIYIIQYCLSITIFQHGLCHRRKYFNNVEGSNALNVCNNVLHSFSPDSECSKNPLYCPARRYQNKDIDSRIFSFEFMDSYFFSLFFESLIFVIDFLSNFIFGLFLLSFQINVNLWLLYLIGFIFILLIICIELFNTYILKLILFHRDFRISKCLHILPSLPIINKMFFDDIAINIITNARNNELLYIFLRMFLSFFNNSLYLIYINISFYLIMKYFINSIDTAHVVIEVDTAGYLTSLYIFIKIMDSMNMVPQAIKIITIAFVSYRRFNKYIMESGPNYYISDNKFTGKHNMSTDLNNKTNEVNKDVVVLYKDASFAWVNNRKDLLNNNYHPFLKNINFELKRGEVAIITGSQGSGKSNFIKSVLGEMTLVGGSMAVIPLHTSMPIFYASQDIWLKKGTIRSNVTFGYKYDESLYNVVLKAVELEYDISTWEKGDMRVVSDYAHTLSGGQRVRMELARAIYAYMIFSQVNKQYNDGKCSFLMCLDSSFNGLDPFVSKTIFNNLFNSKSGLLIKDDLSVIATFNSQSFERSIKSSNSDLCPYSSVYIISNHTLFYGSNLDNFIKSKKMFSKNKYLPSTENCSINYFTSDMFKFCSSGYNTRDGRRILTKTNYERSFKSYINENFTGVKFNPYFIYVVPSLLLFIIFIFMIFLLTFLDDFKFVLSSNLCDYITNNINHHNNGYLVEMSRIRSKSHFYLMLILIFVIVIVILTIVSITILSFCCIVSSRKIHEYCINSIFNNSSDLIKIKKQINKIITYLSIDIFQIDDDLCYSISTTLMALIHTLVSICTLFYLIPISLPFVLISLFTIYRFLFNVYILSSVNIRLAYLETSSQISSVYENAISGSSIYRSFKKESEFFYDLIEHTDYHVRCKFMTRSIRVWSSILSNWAFSFTTLLVLLILIIFDKYTEYNLKIGYFGLGISLSLKVIKTFTIFTMNFGKLEVFMCSLDRFQYFIPPGAKCVFNKSINAHEEKLIVNEMCKKDYKFDKKWIYNRRMSEFKAANKKFIALKKIFFKPKINVVDVTNYVTPEHQGVQLKDVRVYTSLEKNVEGMILKGLTVSAHKSDIIGIIGRTGAGKTTLLSVLENTVRNRTGQVLLDGKDLNDIPKNVTRQIIGVLPQLPFVFKGWTVRRFLDPRKLFSDDEINQALDNCGLLEFVNNLQGGKKLDSIIIPEDIDLNDPNPNFNNRSRKLIKSFNSELSMSVDILEVCWDDSKMLLSNSQLRTLSFARLVLYRYFYRIIIIDEPPSENCEGDEENFVVQDVGIPIYELLQKYFKHCTSFVTAHDVNVLKMCNSVWVMHDGQLIRTCKSQEIFSNESISNIIENVVNKCSS